MTNPGGSGTRRPGASARIQRFDRSQLRTSLLSVPAALSVEAVGFDFVGEVMGCSVTTLNWSGTGTCGYYLGMGTSKVIGSSSNGRYSGYSGFGPYIRSVLNGYRNALDRLLHEATAIHADGVVGISWQTRPLGNSVHEYIALGTAVRARSRTRPPVPFSTDLSGSDFAKLLLSGWVPVALQMTMEMAIRHDDALTRTQERSSFRNRDNVEIVGHSDLAQYTRSAVREKMASQVRASGASGFVVSDLLFDMWERDVGAGHRDHVAMSRIVGTSLVKMRRPAGSPSPSVLTILPLGKG